MEDIKNWDWNPGTRDVAAFGQWAASYEWVEEPTVSPDGEKIAAVVKTGEMEFNVCVNGETWENPFDKIWRLRFVPDGRLLANVSDTGEWTIAVDGQAWENKFEYTWDYQLPRNGGPVVCAAKSGQDYFAVKDGLAWEHTFSNLTELTVSPDGAHDAAAVQTEDFDAADIFKFKEGCYSAAQSGVAWPRNFVNVWDLTFAPDGSRLAAVVRLNLYDYTIAVDGEPWRTHYPSAWRPVFSPDGRSVVAPVKTPGGWNLARDGAPLWKRGYAQLWQPVFSPDGQHLAAIAAPKYGRWTVAVDDVAWPQTFGDYVTDLVLSPDGRHAACLGVEKERFAVVVDGRSWNQRFDMAWQPVFSPDGAHVAAKVESDGAYAIVMDDHRLPGNYAAACSPTFSPDGRALLVRAIAGTGRDARCVRTVIPLNEIIG